MLTPGPVRRASREGQLLDRGGGRKIVGPRSGTLVSLPDNQPPDEGRQDAQGSDGHCCPAPASGFPLQGRPFRQDLRIEWGNWGAGMSAVELLFQHRELLNDLAGRSRSIV